MHRTERPHPALYMEQLLFRVCPFRYQIETLTVADIVLSNPTDNDSQFEPGSSIEERTLQICFKTDYCFPRGTILLLKLVGIIDDSGEKTKICPPICGSTTISNEKQSICIDVTSCNIPLPKGILYLSNVQANCNSVHLVAGNVQKFCFLLFTQKNTHAPRSCPGIPITVRVKNNAECDIKCEKPEIVAQPDVSHSIKIYCQDTKTFVYSSTPHCVTHCQAPKPIVQYYVLGPNFNPSSVSVCGQVCSTCK